MNSTVGYIDFEITPPPEDRMAGKTHISPFVRICVTRSNGITRDGMSIISPQLMTAREIDGFITALKDNLDEVAKRAKRELLAAAPYLQSSALDR